jgi:hypothetical protein
MSAHRITWSELIIAAALSANSDGDAEATMALALAQKGELSLHADRRHAAHPEGAHRCEDDINQWLARSVAIVGGEPVEE